MAHACRFSCNGTQATGQWRREGDHLVVSTPGGAPRALPLGEVSGIGGDGFSIVLRSPRGDLQLDRLGADGPTLLQELRRDWPPLRAGLLRLTDGAAVSRVYTGYLRTPPGTAPFRGFLAGERFVHAIDGEDVSALHLADVRSVDFDEATFSVHCAGWQADGGAVFSRLGAQTAAVLELLRQARAQLAAEADASLARHLPGLAAPARAALGTQWLPGRLMSLAALEHAAPGFQAAFAASWLQHSHRADEGRALLQGRPADEAWLGYGRPGRTLSPQAAGEPAQLLWLLVRGDPVWSLELLSQGDYATYLFTGGSELPALIGGLVQFPQFSREALYLPLADLVDERAHYAIAARDLPLLRQLRERYAGRRIHAPHAAATAGAAGTA